MFLSRNDCLCVTTRTKAVKKTGFEYLYQVAVARLKRRNVPVSVVMNVYSLHQYQKEEDRYRCNSSSKKLARETCQETTGTEPCAQKWHQNLFPFFVNRSKSFKLQIKKKSKICLRIFHYRSLTSHEKISSQLVYAAYRILINYECDIKWTLLNVK